MKPTLPLPKAARAKRSGAFTLIELLTVMAIILVLAGLILAVAGSANYNAAKSRATTEVKAIETACESYKTDNGAYPEGSPTDAINPASDFNPTDAKYTAASQYLYQQLTGVLPTGTPGKSYMTFRPGQLHPMTGTGTADTGSSANYIMDPFGFSYGYSTSNAAAAAAASSAVPAQTPPSGKGYNPTFDLWSTAGYAPGVGKSLPNGMTSIPATYNILWVKNW